MKQLTFLADEREAIITIDVCPKTTTDQLHTVSVTFRWLIKHPFAIAHLLAIRPFKTCSQSIRTNQSQPTFTVTRKLIG